MDFLAFLAGVIAGLVIAAVLASGIFYACASDKGAKKEEAAVEHSSSIASIDEVSPSMRRQKTKLGVEAIRFGRIE